jgi:pentapeptide repeat protein
MRTSFLNADLRNGVLGAWHEGRGSRYSDADFSDSDLRGITSPAATYTNCNFANARLDGIDFQASGFVRCRFAGAVSNVTFWDHGFKTGKPDPNTMEDVDFTQAQLRWVDFRRLDLERVRLPSTPGHLIVTGYPGPRVRACRSRRRRQLICSKESRGTRAPPEMARLEPTRRRLPGR